MIANETIADRTRILFVSYSWICTFIVSFVQFYVKNIFFLNFKTDENSHRSVVNTTGVIPKEWQSNFQSFVSWTGARFMYLAQPWWRHQMETFSALQALCAGISPLTDDFPSPRPVTWTSDVSLVCSWTNGWVNNRDAGGLRRDRTHYGATVMTIAMPIKFIWYGPLRIKSQAP